MSLFNIKETLRENSKNAKSVNNIVFNILSRGLLFLAYAIIARRFGASINTDALYFSINIAGITSSLILIHFNTCIFPEICNQGLSADKHEVRKVSGEYLGFTIFSSATIILVSGFSAMVLLPNKNWNSYFGIRPISLPLLVFPLVSIFICNISDFLRVFLLTQGLAAKSAQATIVQNAVFLLFVTMATTVQFSSKIIIVYVMSQIVGLIVLICLAKLNNILPSISFDPSKYLGFFRVSAIAFAAHLVTCIAGYSFEIKSLSAGEKIVTYINNGMRLANIVNVALVIPALEIISIKLVGFLKKDREEAIAYFTQCVNLFLNLGVVAGINLAVFSNQLVDLLYGSLVYSNRAVEVTSLVVIISGASMPFIFLTQLFNRLLVISGLTNRACSFGVVIYLLQITLLSTIDSGSLDAVKLVAIRSCTEALLVFPVTIYVTIKYASNHWCGLVKNYQLPNHFRHILVAGCMWSSFKVSQKALTESKSEFLMQFDKSLFLFFLIGSLIVSFYYVEKVHKKLILIK